MNIRWLVYKSGNNPETGEYFAEPSTYRKLQVLERGYTEQGEEVFEWVDVPEVKELAKHT